MGIILDTLIAILFAALVLGGLGWLLFREPLRRLGRWLMIWSERDRRLEEERAADAAHRERAEAELLQTVGDPAGELTLSSLTEGRYDPDAPNPNVSNPDVSNPDASGRNRIGDQGDPR